MKRVLLLLLLVACNHPTTEGTELLNLDVSAKLPQELQKRLGPAKTHAQSVELPRGGHVEVQAQVATADDGGKYVTRIIVIAEDAMGWELSALQGGAAPINEGAGPGAAVRMSQTIMVSQFKKSFSGKHFSQAQLRVAWDGSVKRL